MEKLIEIKNLTKDYGDDKGVFDVNLDIYKGEMIGFVGTNGSGKTTTIRNILGFIKPTSGTVTVNGFSVDSNVSSPSIVQWLKNTPWNDWVDCAVRVTTSPALLFTLEFITCPRFSWPIATSAFKTPFKEKQALYVALTLGLLFVEETVTDGAS